MLKILIAPDSFKGTLTPVEAAQAMAKGARKVFPHARCRILPLADGGDGTLAALAAGLPLQLHSFSTADPLGRKVPCCWGLSPDGTAIVESAQANGLARLQPPEYDPLQTSSTGVGSLIHQVLTHGATRLIVTLGGSATVDGGTGMADALGFRHLNHQGQPLAGRGGNLQDIRRILPPEDPSPLRSIPCIGWVDVASPLIGPQGAAPVFAPQKGADPQDVQILQAGLENLAHLWRRDLGKDLRWLPGAGAAGGLGAGLVAYLDAHLTSGADAMFHLLDLDRALFEADLLLTGEGTLDATTWQGKLIGRLTRRAAAAKIPVIALGGSIAPDFIPPPGLPAMTSCSMVQTAGEQDAWNNPRESLAQTTATALEQWM